MYDTLKEGTLPMGTVGLKGQMQAAEPVFAWLEGLSVFRRIPRWGNCVYIYIYLVILAQEQTAF